MTPYPYYFAAVFIGLGALPLPYGYYQLLRLVAVIAFGAAAFIAHEKRHDHWPYILGFSALLFNPFVKIAMPKEFWTIADPVAGSVLGYWAWSYLHEKKHLR